jgi:hypothetical protein
MMSWDYVPVGLQLLNEPTSHSRHDNISKHGAAVAYNDRENWRTWRKTCPSDTSIITYSTYGLPCKQTWASAVRNSKLTVCAMTWPRKQYTIEKVQLHGNKLGQMWYLERKTGTEENLSPNIYTWITDVGLHILLVERRILLVIRFGVLTFY